MSKAYCRRTLAPGWTLVSGKKTAGSESSGVVARMQLITRLRAVALATLGVCLIAACGGGGTPPDKQIYRAKDVTGGS